MKWHVEHPFDEPGTYITDSSSALIAKVYGDPNPSPYLPIPDIEATAKLIADAPQMRDTIERLESLVRTYADGLSAHHTNTHGPCAVCASTND